MNLFDLSPAVKTQEIETDVDQATMRALLARVADCWKKFGASEPHFSVLSESRYKSDRIAQSVTHFYLSGDADVRLFTAAADRWGLALPLSGTCLELGCGVGRVTIALANSFRRVIGVDVSDGHLQQAQAIVREKGYDNVELRQIEELADIDRLPKSDSFYSLMVLQHNPPPVMQLLLRKLIGKLKPNGVGFFQIPTLLPKYRFIAKEYLINMPTEGDIEMHALPHELVLRILRKGGCELIEARNFDCIGIPNSVSENFLIRKLGRFERLLPYQLLKAVRRIANRRNTNVRALPSRSPTTHVLWFRALG